MKKIFFLSAFVALCAFSFAQTFNFGIKAGLNVSNISISGSGAAPASSNNTGFHAGIFADIGFGGFTIQPAVIYTVKGGQQNSYSSLVIPSFLGTTASYNYTVTEKLKLNYIEVPVNVLYHIPIPIGKVFFGGGPYVAYGISGTDNTTTTNTSINTTTNTNTNVTYGSGTGDFKNPDFGINFLAGLILKRGLALSVGYGFGLANLANQSGYTTKNNVFDVSLGYTFL